MTDPCAYTEEEKARLVRHYQEHLNWQETPEQTERLIQDVETNYGARVSDRLVEWEYVLNVYGPEQAYRMYGGPLKYVMGVENTVVQTYCDCSQSSETKRLAGMNKDEFLRQSIEMITKMRNPPRA